MKLYLTHRTPRVRENADKNPYENPNDWIVVPQRDVHDYRDQRNDVIEVEVGPRGAIKATRLVGLSDGPRG